MALESFLFIAVQNKKNDEKRRQIKIDKAIAKLEALAPKLNAYHLKTQKEIKAAINSICKDVKEFIKVKIVTDRKQIKGLLEVPFEYKSYHDKYVHLQLLEYMVKIWRLYIKQHKGEPVSLPIVIPLLICHGRQEWPEGTMRLTSMLSGPVDDLADPISLGTSRISGLNFMT